MGFGKLLKKTGETLTTLGSHAATALENREKRRKEAEDKAFKNNMKKGKRELQTLKQDRLILQEKAKLESLKPKPPKDPLADFF